MACNIFYDFINGAKVQLPPISRTPSNADDDDRHGVRAILNPNQTAQTLLDDHFRMLSEMNGAASGN